jgi:signal transduction histidine kinase
VLLEFIASSAAVVIENVRLRTENEQLLDSLRDRAIKLEQMLKELRELNQHKAEYAQNVSHELRMPLTFVKAYVQLMLDEAMGELTDDMRQTLNVVSQRTETVIRLVNDMISLEKVEVGIMEFEPTSLADVASTAVRGAAVTANKADLQLTLETDDNLPLVNADPGRLGQVFDNLLGNAIKFSPEGGVISVRVFRDGNFIRTDVKDQGIGIPADKLDRIFDRFYQVDGSTTRRFGGTGLGLAIAKSIIEAHGGQVTVTSELHVGSTFSFLLPIPHHRD